MPVNRGPDQHSGDRFCSGSRIPESINAIAIEVMFIGKLSVPRDENAGDGLEVSRFDRLLHLT